MRYLECEVLRDRKHNGGCQELGQERNGDLVFKGYTVSVWENEKILEVVGGDGCTTI